MIRNSEWIITNVEGKIKKKTGRDRSRYPFIKQILEDVGRATYKKLKVDVMNKDEWRSIKVI